MRREYVYGLDGSADSRQPVVNGMTPRGEHQGLARAVRQLRNERGLSQEELAHRAGLTAGAVNAIEGARRNPTWGTVQAVAAGLDVSLADLAALSEKLDRR